MLKQVFIQGPNTPHFGSLFLRLSDALRGIEGADCHVLSFGAGFTFLCSCPEEVIEQVFAASYHGSPFREIAASHYGTTFEVR